MDLTNIIQMTSGSSTSDPASATFDAPVTPGNTIIAVHYFVGGTSEPSDLGSWVSRYNYNGGVNRRTAVWSKVADESTGQTHSFVNGSGGTRSVFLFEVSSDSNLIFGDSAGNSDQSVNSIDVPDSAPLSVDPGGIVFTSLFTTDLGSEYPDNYTPPVGYTIYDPPTRNFVVMAKAAESSEEGPITHSWTSTPANVVSLLFSVHSDGPATQTPGLPATTILDKDGNPLASTQVAITVTAGATTLYDDTPTTDGSGLLPELDFSAHGSEPEVHDEVTWTITAGGITQSVTRTLVDLGD